MEKDLTQKELLTEFDLEHKDFNYNDMEHVKRTINYFYTQHKRIVKMYLELNKEFKEYKKSKGEKQTLDEWADEFDFNEIEFVRLTVEDGSKEDIHVGCSSYGTFIKQLWRAEMTLEDWKNGFELLSRKVNGFRLGTFLDEYGDEENVVEVFLSKERGEKECELPTEDDIEYFEDWARYQIEGEIKWL